MTDLSDDYANGDYIEGANDYPARWAAAAAQFRNDLGGRATLGISYGPSARQVYDLFQPVDTPKGVLVFVHGGYWRAFDRSAWSFLARGAIEQGWAVAMPSYDLCPTIRIAGITQQIALAVQVIAARVAGPISLAGHSAGGHAVARMVAPRMLPVSVTERLHHVVPISPLSDLEPLCQTTMNADFQMDKAMAQAESPLLQPAPTAKVSIWVGDKERPAFLDQAIWLAEAWECDCVMSEGQHHFNVIDSLTDPHSDMVRRLTGN